MKKIVEILSSIARVFTVAVLMAVAWTLSSILGLFHQADGKSPVSVSPLFKLNKAQADIPPPSDSTPISPGDAGDDGDGGDGGY